MVAPEFFLVNSAMASCWKAVWNVDPLPWRVPDTLAPVVVAPPAVVAAAAAVVAVAPPAVVAAAAAVVADEELPELSLPQAAPTSAIASTPAMAAPRRLVMFTRWSPLLVKPRRTLRRPGEPRFRGW